MLTPVALGQVRFTLPGLVPDARGVVTGKQLAVRFATLDRLVWFLRLLSADRASDELWSGMTLRHVRSGVGLREMVVSVPTISTHVADAVARAARTAAGQCFTGTGRHFVQYRDRHAPLGYDPTEMAHDPADLSLYATDHTAHYRFDGELPLERIVFGLELRRHPGPIEPHVPTGPGTSLYLTARRSLGPRLVEHLFRADISARAAFCEPDRPSAFGLASGFWLFRIDGLPERLLGLLARTPGLGLYVPVLDNLAVTAGYEHPLHLEACRSLLAGDRFVLMAPAAVGVTVLAPPPALVPIGDLLQMRLHAVPEPAVANARPGAARDLELTLRLEPTAGDRPRVVGSWIPWSQAAWFRRLCYALPSIALRGHRVAALEPALLVVAPDELEAVPLGQLLHRAAPGVLVPMGYTLRPALEPEVLAERFGLGEGSLLVFPGPETRPFRVSAALFEPLDRRLLAGLRLEQELPALAPRDPDLPEESGPDVEHGRLGAWPLWGVDR